MSEINSTCEVTKVKGRLRKCMDAWFSIKAKVYYQNFIVCGYKISFVSTPPPLKACNNKSDVEEKEFVEEAINELLRHECICGG